MILGQTLTKALFEAILAAEDVYTASEEWRSWAHAWQVSLRFERGAALEASASACADADAQSGREHFAALAAFHAATAVAWAAGSEERAARESCRAAKRNAERANKTA
jgi:hypothetical protein